MDGLWSDNEQIFVDHAMTYAVVGGPETIKTKLNRFIDQTDADEVIVSMPIFDMDARLKSVRLFADASNGWPMRHKNTPEDVPGSLSPWSEIRPKP